MSSPTAANPHVEIPRQVGNILASAMIARGQGNPTEGHLIQGP